MRNPVWYQRVAAATREIANNCGGAFVMTRERLREEAIIVDGRLAECPQQVWEHMTLAMQRVGLSVRPFEDAGKAVLMIFGDQFDAEGAAHHCEKVGIPADVRIALADTRVAVA